jgi:hypothetical protein
VCSGKFILGDGTEKLMLLFNQVFQRQITQLKEWDLLEME